MDEMAILYEKEVNNLYEFDAIVLLQPTFPIRTIEMLDGAIVKYFEKEESLITVVKSLEVSKLFTAKFLILSTISTTSSATPLIVENSC